MKLKLHDIDIEQLMAYADGVLDPAQQSRTEQLLRDDPEARDIVERFRRTRPLLAPGLDPLLDEPVPQHLVDAIRRHPGPVAASAAAPLPVPAASRPAANDRWYWPTLATAARPALRRAVRWSVGRASRSISAAASTARVSCAP